MSFLLITLRRLAKEKYYALLCILSLSLGISSAMLISLFLFSELTFDRHNEKHERLYRVTLGLDDIMVSFSGYEVGPLLVRDNPQFLDSVRFRDADEKRFSYGDNSNEWEDVFQVDASVFELFTITPISGELESAFDDPFSIAISESFAQYYFGAEDPIGELLSTEKYEFRVTLVYEDPPENVTQRYDAMLPFELVEIYQPNFLESASNKYFSGDINTFIYVAEYFNPNSMEAALAYFFETYVAAVFDQIVGPDAADLKFRLGLQKSSDMHFDNQISFEEGTGNITDMTIFAAVAAALLLISCINYINLSTARAGVRAKEVAIKKILGVERRSLVLQFLAESIFFVSLAFALSVALTVAAAELGLVETFTDKTELSELLFTPNRFAVFVLAGLMVGALSGIYPALKLSGKSMLQPKKNTWRLGLPLRQLLVLMQMTASIIIVACVFIMLRQTAFLAEASLGFKKENQLVVELRSADAIRGRDALINELTGHNEILSVVEMGSALGRGLSTTIGPVEDQAGQMRTLTTNSFRAGDTFLETLEIELLQGSMFRTEQMNNEYTPILVNETLVREMEWVQAIGRTVIGGEVVGVIRDFHYLPFHEPIAPTTIRPYWDGFLDNLPASSQETASIDLMISITGIRLAETRAFIMQAVDRHSSQTLIEVLQFDELWNELYEEDGKTVSLVTIFSAICVIISMLGLGGLTAYNTQQRGKEVAIRKVLGASVPNVIGMLSVSMIRVFVLSIIPAIAGAYYLSELWLERFSYRVEISSTPYLAAILLVGLVSLATLVAQTYRTAQANPVLKLKYE